jgi:carbon storage regulator
MELSDPDSPARLTSAGACSASFQVIILDEAEKVGLTRTPGFGYNTPSPTRQLKPGYDSLPRIPRRGRLFFDPGRLHHGSRPGSSGGEMVFTSPGMKRVKDSTRPQEGMLMLVLTRRPGEEIVIDGKIRITIVSVKGDRIRLGIDAPLSVAVDRKEVHERRRQLLDPMPHFKPPSGSPPSSEPCVLERSAG